VTPASSDRLQVTTPSDREIVLSRVFDAPRRLVFDAWTKPELMVRWFGPRGWTMVVCEIDLRPGGAYRYVLHGPAGAVMTISGVYREIVPPARLVCTEVYGDRSAGPAADEAVITAEFVEQAGKTTWTARIVYPSPAARDAVLNSRMEIGLTSSLDRLATLLRAMAG
jgi:uncharacterized protein YndB with AHSA1/START domain